MERISPKKRHLILAGLVGLLIAYTSSANDLRLHRVVSALDLVPSGRALLKRAESVFQVDLRRNPESLLEWSTVSHTDSELVREFDFNLGREVRKRKVKVLLRESQSDEALLFDLAHELTHASQNPSWDPYDPSLTAVKYIQAVIDGPGGEVEAVVQECQIALEWKEYKRSQRSVGRCERYWDPQRKVVDRNLIRKDFYRVGEHYSELLQKLGGVVLDALSSEPVTLLSSTGRAPYPVALYEEYLNLNRVACENSFRRIEGEGRRIAGEWESNARKMIELRCNVNRTQGFAQAVEK